MNTRIQLHEAREARDTLAQMVQDRTDAIADRHPLSSAAQLRALYVSDPEVAALTWALTRADERVAELQARVDAQKAMARRVPGEFMQRAAQGVVL